jgi:uncharacterized protein YprB with RNaseH-like and TPR domain
MSDVRRRLDDLKAAGTARASRGAAQRQPGATRLVDVIGGCERQCAGRPYWILETLFDRACPQHAVQPEALATPLHHRHGRAPPVVIEPRRTLVVDIETGGFAGMPVFLVGLVLLDQRPLSVVQLLARDYPEEETVLRALAEVTAGRDTWVTFNGKSFDEPFLRDRATLHHVPLPGPQMHLDLLHAARRMWRHELPNCRLKTLEEHILKRVRVGDIPSSDVPDLFLHFIRTGNAAPLRPVLEHNQIDLVSATELLLRLSRPVP